MSTDADDPAFARPSVPGCFEQDGLTYREYLIAHAPPMPAVVLEKYWELLRTNEPGHHDLPWNEFTLGKLAMQEARWRNAYADAILDQQERQEAKDGLEK